MCRRRSPSVTMPSSRPPVVDDAGHAEPLAGHLVNDVRHRRVATRRAGRRRRRASALRRASGVRPSRPPGCRSAKCSASEALALRQRHASASPSASAAVVLAVGARFIGHASSATWQLSVTSDAWPSVDCGCPVSAISRAPIRRIGFEQPDQFLGLAAVRQRDDDVVGLDDAEIAVHGLGRVQEDRRRARARQRRRDLARDDAGLAHAGHDDAAGAALQQHRARASKRRVELRDRARESPAPRFRARWRASSSGSPSRLGVARP